MADQRGFEKPNHTQTPNTFFDVSLPEIKSLVELKIVLAVIRQTFGWQKDADRISLSQLQRLTGLSRESVSIGIQLALDHGYVERKPVRNGFLYNLKLVRNSDQSGIPTSQEFRPKVVRDSDQKVVGIPDPQKKGKEKKESNTRQDQLFESLAAVCRIDWKVCTAEQRAQLNQSVGILRKAGHTPQEVQTVGKWWVEYDWRGRKGQAPRPADIREVWQQAFEPVRVLDEHPNAYRPGKMIL